MLTCRCPLGHTHQERLPRRGHKAVVFVLDELDAFARRPKQALLYSLLDALHRSDMQARLPALHQKRALVISGPCLADSPQLHAAGGRRAAQYCGASGCCLRACYALTLTHVQPRDRACIRA